MSQDFIAGFIEALFFTNEELSNVHDLTPESKSFIIETCHNFLNEKIGNITVSELLINEECPFYQAGIDFLLTRDGHGTGFWDCDYCSIYLCDALTNLCGYGTKYPQINAYQVNDEIHVE